MNEFYLVWGIIPNAPVFGEFRYYLFFGKFKELCALVNRVNAQGNEIPLVISEHLDCVIQRDTTLLYD